MIMERSAKSELMACNCMALRRAARGISNFYDSQLAPSGLRATQFAILVLVNMLGEASVNAVAERLALDRTTAGKNLRPLEAAGLVNIAPSKKDGRQRAIRLTKAGKAALKAAMPLWRRAQARFESANGADKAATLRATLGSLKFQS
jgi:DNA-binding MarR family transcriptional regulator